MIDSKALFCHTNQDGQELAEGQTAERNTALRSNPTQTDQLIFDKGVRSAQWGGNSLSTNGLGQSDIRGKTKTNKKPCLKFHTLYKHYLEMGHRFKHKV